MITKDKSLYLGVSTVSVVFFNMAVLFMKIM